ncbi:acetate/propionate family kinase [Falsihalocynthiibacter arcticus]|uniref:Uncharacterized protein n=1 Tax=Falsihalocynthiibacter arcticus TaxID=1579316 RepID=A0A126V0A0_9RHOB|nr:acetate/propionate family kinase [Falsihalocynthiibacter arcticus]AML51758.1 hypothetical protein RC74_11230 [Falsihalocynthiibacter arcticus]
MGFILRYGFHGLSYEYIACALPQHLGRKAKRRVIVAHPGSGATSMRFTPQDSLMMGRRRGALAPEVMLYLPQEKSMSATDIASNRGSNAP